MATPQINPTTGKPILVANPRDAAKTSSTGSSQVNPTSFASSGTVDQIQKTPAPTGVQTGTKTTTSPVKTPTDWEIQQGFYLDANLLKPGQTRVGPGGQTTNFGDQMRPTTVGEAAASGVTDPNIIGSYAAPKSPLQKQNEAVMASAAGKDYSSQMTEGLAEQIGKMQAQLNEVSEYGKGVGGSFSQLLKSINEQQTIFSTKLQDFARQSITSQNRAAAEASKTGEAQGMTGTQIRGAQQGLPDRDVAPGVFKAMADQKKKATSGSKLLYDQQYFGDNPDASTLPSPEKKVIGKNAITPPPAASTGNTVDDAANASTTSFLTNYIDNFGSSNDVSQFADGTNSYGAILKDMTNIIQAGIVQSDANFSKIVDNLDKRAKLMQSEYDATRSRLESSADRMLTKAEQIKDNELKANEYAMNKDLGRHDDAIDQMEDNNSRYLGFLQAKFASAGMLDSSAGMQLIGKYTATANMQLRYAVQDRSDVQAMYLGKQKDILDTYFDRAYEIESDKESKLQEMYFKTQSGLLDIDEKLLQSEDMKQKGRIAAAKELTSATLQIKQQASNELIQLRNAKLQEAQFEHTKIMDQVKNEQWAQQFGLSLEQFEEQKTNNSFQRDLSQNQFNFSKSSYWNDFGYKQKQDKIAADQWQQTYKLQKDQLISADKRSMADNLISLREKGVLSDEAFMMGMGNVMPEMLGTMMNNVTEAANVSYGDQKFVDRVSKAESMAAQQRASKGNSYQCVQFARDIIPDLPMLGTNDSLQNKINKLVNSPNGSQTPVPGAVVVLDWGGNGSKGNKSSYPGHVAVVTSVNPETNSFNITQFNVPAGQHSTDTIKMDDKAVMGYWLSPKLGYQTGPSVSVDQQKLGGGATQMFKGLIDMALGGDVNEGLKNLSSGFSSLTGSVGFDRNAVLGAPSSAFQTSIGQKYTSLGIPVGGTQQTSPILKSGRPNMDVIPKEVQPLVNSFWDISSKAGSVSQMKDTRETFMSYLQSGDYESADRFLTQQAIGTLPEKQKNKFYTYEEAQKGIDDSLASLGDVGGMNMYRSILENNIKPFLALEQSGNWREAKATFQGAIMGIRNEILGATLTDSELKSYDAIFPNWDKATAQDVFTSLRAFRTKLLRDRKTIMDVHTGNIQPLY